MKTRTTLLTIVCIGFSTVLQARGQGHLVANGVVSSGLVPGAGYQIDVLHDPTNLYYTGFFLKPVGQTPSSPYTNTFAFDPFVDVGVRVFLVLSNAPISLQPVLAGNYTELKYPATPVFNSGSPFYVGFYTGNVTMYPPNGIYNDPLFGWAELVNNRGVIQLLNSALEYQGGGIYAGTLTIIPIPEPSVLTLVFLGAVGLCGTRFCRDCRAR